MSKQNTWRLRRAIAIQNDIGWYNFQLGRVAQRITDYQDDYYRRWGYQRTGLRWTVALINKLHSTAWDMWEHRNAILHGPTEDYHTKLETAKADAAIKKEFKKGKTGILRRHKGLFKSRRQTLHMPLMDKLRWLDSVKGARRAWRTAAPTYDAERAGIINWQRTGRCHT